MPVPIITKSYDETPTKTVTISDEWLGLIIGLLLPLTSASEWDGTPAENENASEEVDELIDYLMT